MICGLTVRFGAQQPHQDCMELWKGWGSYQVPSLVPWCGECTPPNTTKEVRENLWPLMLLSCLLHLFIWQVNLHRWLANLHMLSFPPASNPLEVVGENCISLIVREMERKGRGFFSLLTNLMCKWLTFPPTLSYFIGSPLQDLRGDNTKKMGQCFQQGA